MINLSYTGVQSPSPLPLICLDFCTEDQDGILNYCCKKQTCTLLFVLTFTNAGKFKWHSKHPSPGPICLAFCTEEPYSVLNQWYESQSRTRSVVLAHTNTGKFKGGTSPPPRFEKSGFLHRRSGWCT